MFDPQHLHYFANSGGPADTTPLERLKRTVLPMTRYLNQIFILVSTKMSSQRSRLYTLFRHIFSHWPHDSSFRLVLETWLSFIQVSVFTSTVLESCQNLTKDTPQQKPQQVIHSPAMAVHRQRKTSGSRRL